MSSTGESLVYQTIDGILMPMFSQVGIRDALDYRPKPEDVFIATYPKCGTTWMQFLALHILRKGLQLDHPGEFHVLSPFIEARGAAGIEGMPRPGVFKTHFPRTHIPYSPEAKYIYVLRNPKDCFVSMYHHMTRAEAHFDQTFDEYFEAFMDGQVMYNDYFDHLASWYPHVKDQQVFFTTYEAMKEDLRDIALRLSSFLGKEYVEAIEKDNAVLSDILRCSSFEYMMENYREFDGLRRTFETGERSKPPENYHVRKGIVGDWRGRLSEDQSERLDKKFKERTEGTEIFEMYKTYMGL